MSFFQNILRIMDTAMEVPAAYGWFHILFWLLTIGFTVFLCLWYKNRSADQIRHMVLVVTIVVIVLEIYKQINYSFSYENGIAFDYQWYAFPFQFCSTPMYIGLLAGLTKKGRIHDAACAYLATYAIFAGTCVMIYPNDVFIDTIGINIQTMICHGTMLCIGVCLLFTGHVKLEHKSILKAMPIFAACVGLAVIMNELAYQSGLLETETFNMFFVSPYCDPSLLIYSDVQAVVPFPWSLIIYIGGFTLAAYVILLIAMGIGALSSKKAKQAPLCSTAIKHS